MSLELPTPRSCVKSHLNDKPTCCLPLRPQSRHSDLWYFGAQLLSLQPCCLRLAHYITVTHSRLASNAVVSSLFDRISTCRIARPSLDALSGTNVFLPGTGTGCFLPLPMLQTFYLPYKFDCPSNFILYSSHNPFISSTYHSSAIG